MDILYWLGGGFLTLCLIVLATAYVCYRMAFYASDKDKAHKQEYPIPEGEIYAPYRESMIGWIKEVRQMPREAMEITSHDGLTLRGYYYEYAPDAPIELMFPGYRGDAERDLCGGVQRCFALGHSALIVDQRACGRSDGHVISFGINESKDCLRWLEAMLDRFGPDVKIILTGISMGAATVMIASGTDLPKNVIGVLADCGYTSAKEIIQKVIAEDMKLPPKAAYPFVKLGARIFGKFDLEETSPTEAVRRSKVPVVFAHGDADAYVPCYMSEVNYETCASYKRLIIVPGAGHGLCYPIDPENYLKKLKDFWTDVAALPAGK